MAVNPNSWACGHGQQLGCLKQPGCSACHLLLCMSVLLAGCGGGDEPASPSPRPAADAPNVPKKRVPVVKSPEAKKDKPKDNKQAGTVPPRDRSLLFSGERFEIVERQPNYEILGRDHVDEADLFAVRLPSPGIDSTSFETLVPQPKAASSQPNPSFQLPQGFTPLTDAGYSEEGLPLRIRCEKDGSVMALIPAGVFLMGTNDGPSNASPQMSVYLDPYYIDVTEITVGQFERYRKDLLETQKRFRPAAENASSPPDHPVLGVSWGEARFYARWAGKELPTEAEWEKAGRGPEGYTFPWGNGRAIWPGGRTTTQIDPVRSYRTDRSRYGVFDLAGNAREWCRDFYSEQAFQEALRKSSAAVLRNWQGPDRPSQPHRRVVKGNGPDWVLWHRRGVHMNESGPKVGFRCVLRVDLPESDSEDR